ncbi:MAG: hypothetical protein NTU93_00070, partial [Arthrobacter sp.]|nr:hypothetical protein [Arthrobacter sp.]
MSTDAEAIKDLLHAADLASATPNSVEYTVMRAALRDAADPIRRLQARARQLQPAASPPDAQAGEPTPPVSRCCPVCDRPYHTDEDECPICRKQFASSIAAPAQVPPPADDALIAEVEALCAKATPGPWANLRGDVHIAEPGNQHKLADVFANGDATFIAASRELLPKLATALREARAADRAICEECTLMDQRKRIAELERDLVESRARAER